MPEDAHAVDACACAEVLHAFEPTFDDLSREGLTGLKFAEQEPVEIPQNLEIPLTAVACRAVGLPVAVETERDCTSKNTGCHGLLGWPWHRDLAQGVEVGLGIDERCIDVPVTQHVRDRFDRSVMGERSNCPRVAQGMGAATRQRKTRFR